MLTRYAMLVIGAVSSCLCAWGGKPVEAQAEFPVSENLRGHEEIELNAAADKVIRELGGVWQNDLYGKMDPLDRAKEWRDMFHFQPRAIKMQSKWIASACLKAGSMSGDGSDAPTGKAGR